MANRIPRNMASAEITILLDTVAGKPGTTATVYKSTFDGYTMRTAAGDYYSIPLSLLRNSDYTQINKIVLFPEEPKTDHATLEKLRETMQKYYNYLYDTDDTAEASMYCSLFDVWQTKHREFIAAFTRFRNDYVSSDREGAAFMMALFLGDFSRNETTKQPRPIKTRTYNNFMRVYKMILAKGYTHEESETITRGIFDDFEKRPFLSIFARVSFISEKRESTPATITGGETTPNSPETITGETTPENIQQNTEADTATAETLETSHEIATERPETITWGNNTTTPKTSPQGATERHTGGESRRPSAGVPFWEFSPVVRGSVAVSVGVFSRYGFPVSRSVGSTSNREQQQPRHACEIAPQRTETAQAHTTTTPRNKTPSRGSPCFLRFRTISGG